MTHLGYTKGRSYFMESPIHPSSHEYIESTTTNVDDKTGRRYTLDNLAPVTDRANLIV